MMDETLGSRPPDGQTPFWNQFRSNLMDTQKD
jgi:hypothetical protein